MIHDISQTDTPTGVYGLLEPPLGPYQFQLLLGRRDSRGFFNALASPSWAQASPLHRPQLWTLSQLGAGLFGSPQHPLTIHTLDLNRAGKQGHHPTPQRLSDWLSNIFENANVDSQSDQLYLVISFDWKHMKARVFSRNLITSVAKPE